MKIIKTKTFDFIFVYEIKARELENICLLKLELENRGYCVKFINSWENLNRNILKYKTEVLVGFAGYDTATIQFVLSYVKSAKKYINLQWEQLLTNEMLTDKNSPYQIKGYAKKIGHVSWGEKNKERLVTVCSVDSNNVCLTGHIGLDYLKEDFIKYYLPVKKIKKLFHLPQNRKIYLFISSFSYVDIPDLYLDNHFDYFSKISIKSQTIIIKWIEKFLQQNKSISFIYRPHPAERNNIFLKSLTKRFKNFYVIDKYSVKQWIIVSDHIYTWYSTSVIDAYFTGKHLSILRPITIPNNLDIPIFEHANTIQTYQQFINSTCERNCEFPIPEKELLSYYHYNNKIPAYKKTADFFERVYKNNICNIPAGLINQIEKDDIWKLIRQTTLFHYFYMVWINYRCIHGDKEAKKIQKFEIYAKEMKNKNKYNKTEVKDIINRLNKILHNF